MMFVAVSPPAESVAPKPPICDAVLEHVKVNISTDKVPTQRHFISCFGTSTKDRPGDDVVVSGSIYPAPGPGRRWTGSMDVTEVAWGTSIFSKSVTGPSEEVQALILQTREAVLHWRADSPKREAASRKSMAAFKDVVVVVDSTLALPLPERVALDLVLGRMKRYGLTVLEHVDAAERADELTRSKVVLLTADVRSKEESADPTQRTGWRHFSVDVRIKMTDGTTRVGQEVFVIGSNGINVDKAMQSLAEMQLAPHARRVAADRFSLTQEAGSHRETVLRDDRSPVEEHADRLVSRLIDHFKLDAPKPKPSRVP